jgi:hypothetical protein
LNNVRKLANGTNASVVPEEKRLQIVSQNDTHISIDETGNIFSIKGFYNLN